MPDQSLPAGGLSEKAMLADRIVSLSSGTVHHRVAWQIIDRAYKQARQEERETLKGPARELIAYLVYSECARCELVNPERYACQCPVCDRLAELIQGLRSALNPDTTEGEAADRG